MTQQPSPTHDSRSLLAIFLCIVFYLGYQKYISWKYPDLRQASNPSTQALKDRTPQLNLELPPPEPPVSTPNSSAPFVKLSQDQLTFVTDTSEWVFSQSTGGPQSVKLKNYRNANDTGSPPVNLLDSPMTVRAMATRQPSADQEILLNAERAGQTLKLWHQEGPFKILQEYTIPDKGYLAHLKVTYENVSDRPQPLYGTLLIKETPKPQKASSILGFIPGVITHQDQLVSFVDTSGQWSPLKDFCKEGTDDHRGSSSALKYLGLDRHYFLALLIPKSASTDFVAERTGTPQAEECGIKFTLGNDLGNIDASKSFSMDYDIYMGPKETKALEAAHPQLTTAMHLGFFDFIASILMIIIDSFYAVFKNYGLAIIFLTIVLKTLFYPLVKISQVSMHQMKKLNPQMAAIREKWKDDKARQQQELLKFMSQHKVNPMKGCLPILPQIPVFFAFYQVLQTSINLRHAPFFGWIQDLSAMDPYLITPLLMGVAMFVQQKMTPTTGMDKTQEKILLFMPVMFTAMMLTLPAGLTLYMLTNTVVGIGQQRWLMKRLESN